MLLYIYYDYEKLKKGVQMIFTMSEKLDNELLEANPHLKVAESTTGPLKMPIYDIIIDRIRECETNAERIEHGYITLTSEEFLDDDDSIVNIHTIPCDPNIILKVFDFELKKWVEGASDVDRVNKVMGDIEMLINRRYTLTEALKISVVFQKELDDVNLKLTKKEEELNSLLYPNN
ncbi:MAG: hypothetical protein ACRCX8_16760 [Sarcina sp.]